jgi:two-component system NarL family sensor kinase
MAPDRPGPVAPEVQQVAVEHARRGVALQVGLRWVLVAFVALTVLAVPPPADVATCAVIAAVYAALALGVAVRTRRWPAVAPSAWPVLFVDVVALGVLTLLTGVDAPQSWTSDVFTTGFLLVPVLAATLLRPSVCAAVVAPAALVYLLAGIATQEANGEPWASLLLRALIAAGVAAGCVGLSRIQQSRVETIGGLVAARSALLAELTGLEQRERQALAEHLHDGALQYVLAARQDLEDARDTGDPATFDRLEIALAESSRLLRSTVADLHPSVLARAGLASGLRDLARAATRGTLRAEVTTDGWPDDLRTPVDPLLYRTARELLANVVRHAHARSVTVSLALVDGWARLVVADDGVGMTEGDAQRGPEQGHIGLASHAVRVGAAGGHLTVAPAVPSGTVVSVEVPMPRPTAAYPTTSGRS